MEKKKYTNEELDKATAAILRAGTISTHEIDNIVAAPMLFNSIKRRIEADRVVQEKKGFWALLKSPALWNWHRAAVACAVSLIFLAGTITIFVVVKRSDTNDALANSTSLASSPKQPAQVKPIIESPSAFEQENEEQGPHITQASYKREPVRAERPAPRRVPVRRNPAPTFEAGGDFYPVSYTGGSMDEITHGGQIVRTEIPRSSLFAMGVDLPVESANEKIKTDLLIGPDGVVRGVRIVK